MNESEPVRFGVFEVDLLRRELRKHGLRLKLQEQPFLVLEALLQKHGELVTRDELRLLIWGPETFVDFDQSLNRAVNKLREALGDSAENPRFIETMSRRGYRFVAPVVPPLTAPVPEAPPAPALPAVSRPAWARLLPVAVAAVAVLCGGLFWIARQAGSGPPPKVVQLTTFTGEETHPAFSPGGKAVAFAWNGEKRDNWDVYVKAVGDSAALRLTSHPALDVFPSWSPDGKYIAFVSYRPEGGVFLITPLGGAERKLASLLTDGRPSWSADSKFLLVTAMYREIEPMPDAGALFLVPVEGEGEPRRILAPPRGAWYAEAVLSPDQRSLAFALCSGSLSRPGCSLQVAGLKNGLYPLGTPRQITARSIVPQGLAWTADGASLVYGAGGSGPGFLWRVPVTGNSAPERLDIAGSGASYPAIDRKTGRLAFTRSVNNSDIWRIGADGTASPFLTSTLRDTSPQYSPDGGRIAFESGRGGDSIAIWLANADGSGVTQATRLASEQCGSPRWSPEGRWIAFDCFDPEAGWNIWVIEAVGATPRRLTHGGGDNIAPSWSHDGRWIYYGATRSGRFEIWRVPVAGGGVEQVTRNGGYVALPSVDGKVLYYTKSEFGVEGLFAKRLPDGDEAPLIQERIGRRGFVVFSDGIYYLGAAGQQFKIRYYEFATRDTRVLAEVEGPLQLGLAVSPDRKTFLFSKVVFAGSDLMLIENFR